MEPTYNEQEIAEHYLGVIKQKRAQGFTDEQIAKDIGFPLETVQRVNTEDTLPENPNEDTNEELPMDGNKKNESNSDSNNSEEKLNNIPEGGTYTPGINTKGSGDDVLPMEGTGNAPDSSEMDAESENSESGSRETSERNDSDIQNKEQLDVKEEYTLEQSAEDMFSDDAFKQLKAEFAQTKIRHSKLFNHIGKVMTGEEEDVMPVEMLQIKADAMQVYLTVLGVQMNMVKRMEKEIKKEEDK